MKIYFMKQKALDSLQAEVADNLNKYQSSSFWMDEHFINQNMPKYYFDTGIEVADYQLISGGPETDFQNAKIVFEAFKNKLNPVQASDLRLWAYLAHVQHNGESPATAGMDAIIPAAIVIATTAAPTDALTRAAIRNATKINGRPLFSSAGPMMSPIPQS